jgi:hypothetical protein
MKPIVPSKPTPPRWWSPGVSIWIAIVFIAIATVPYISSATKLVAAGKPLSVEGLQKEAYKDRKKHEEPDRMREVKAFALAADGTVYAGGKAGLFQRDGSEWKPVADYPGHDAKALAITAAGELIVVEEKAAYERSADGVWSTTFEGEAFTVATAANGDAYLTLKKGGGVLRRVPGGKWEAWADALPISETAMREHHEKEKNEHAEKKRDEKKEMEKH